MKKKCMRVLSVAVTIAVLLCFTASPIPSFAFSKNSEQKLPHTGAYWKSWAQGNSAWATVTIGNGTSANLGNSGCTLTSIAMAAKSYRILLKNSSTDNITPASFTEKCKDVGTVEFNGSYNWAKTNLALENVLCSASWKQEGLNTVSAMTNAVKAKLDDTSAHYIVIVCFNGQHYVTADHVAGNTLYVYDPGVGAVTTLETAVNRKSNYSLSGFYYFQYTGAIRGDADGNGIVDSTDARLVLQFAVGKNVIVNEDVINFNDDYDGNGNSKIDSTDANLILQNATYT